MDDLTAKLNEARDELAMEKKVNEDNRSEIRRLQSELAVKAASSDVVLADKYRDLVEKTLQ